jgi:drug/metabolite transporter (DMT)-like permease
MFAVYLAWGSTYLAIRLALESIPPFILGGTRFFTAGLILYAWQRLAGAPAPRPVEWRSAAIVGGLLLVGGNGSVIWAEQTIPSGIAALMVSTSPIWMVLLDSMLSLGQRPSWLTIIGVLVGFGGVVVLIGPGQFNGGAEALNPLGLSVLLMAGLLWGSGSIYNRGARLPKSPLLGVGMQMLAGAAGFFILATFTGEWARLELTAITARSLWALSYLIVAGALIAYSAYIWLLRVAPTPLVSTYAYVNPLIAVFIGNLIAQEPLNARILVSTAIILGAVALINSQRMKAPRQAAPPLATADHASLPEPTPRCAGGKD